MSKELVDAVVDMREEDAVKIAENLLNSGADPLGLLDDCREALGIIGSRFAAGNGNPGLGRRQSPASGMDRR